MLGVATPMLHDNAESPADPSVDFGGGTPNVSRQHEARELLRIQPGIEDTLTRHRNCSADDEIRRAGLVRCHRRTFREDLRDLALTTPASSTSSCSRRPGASAFTTTGGESAARTEKG